MFELKQFYCFADPVFFEDVSRWSKGPGFLPDRDFPVTRLAVPEGWSRQPRGIWVSLRPDGHVLPEQGWKIHISATMANADRLGSLVWDYCVARRLPFKHVRDRNMLVALNAKYAARGSSGKLITIYPGSDEEFATAVTELAALTAGEPGPYILSDLRIGDGPVYVRYGGFIAMDCLDENGEWVRAIRRPDGTLEPDRRKPFFDPPPWAAVPEVLVPHIAARRAGGSGSGSAPPPYRVQRALHFSNAGGIYLATRTGDGATVILKEARPHAGLDDNHEDAVTRQQREVWALRKLQGIDGVPELYEQFELSGHHFLAEEYIEGQPLHVWYGVHHPWVVRAEPTAEEIAEYTRRAVHIVSQLETLLATIHARGIVFGDLHIGNIIVRPDDSIALVDFELAFDASDTDWRPGLRATGFGHSDKRGLDVDRYSLAAVRLAIFLTSSRIAALEPRKIYQFVRILRDNFPVPDGWAESILAELAPAPDSGQPTSHVDFDAPVVDWDTVGKSLTEAILSSATPDRTDRLFPGAPEQFAHGGGLNMAYGAAGVLWTLSVAGRGRYPEHERWLLDGARRTQRLAPGFYDGAAGVAYALDHLGHPDAADELLDRHLRQAEQHQGLSLFSGLSGIGATLLHFGRSRGDRGHLDNAVGIAGRLAEAVRHGDPGRVLDSYRNKPVDAGLMRGWSGVALFLIRLYEHTGDAGYLDLAAQAVHHDLDRCVVTDDGALMVEEAGVRTMPYLDVGAAGIALAIDELLTHRDDERGRDSLPQLLLGSCRRFAVQAELFRGFASQIATLARLNHRVDHRRTLDRHLRELSWHALSYRGHLAFPGTLGFRLSMDLVTGSAGILFAISAATREPQPFLPFFSDRG